MTFDQGMTFEQAQLLLHHLNLANEILLRVAQALETLAQR